MEAADYQFVLTSRIYNNNVSIFLSGAFILAFLEEKKGNYGSFSFCFQFPSESL